VPTARAQPAHVPRAPGGGADVSKVGAKVFASLAAAMASMGLGGKAGPVPERKRAAGPVVEGDDGWIHEPAWPWLYPRRHADRGRAPHAETPDCPHACSHPHHAKMGAKLARRALAARRRESAEQERRLMKEMGGVF
jgi:hypothetical protein